MLREPIGHGANDVPRTIVGASVVGASVVGASGAQQPPHWRCGCWHTSVGAVAVGPQPCPHTRVAGGGAVPGPYCALNFVSSGSSPDLCLQHLQTRIVNRAMSSSLWAFEAARKSSESLVPGTSRHITSEMKSTLVTAANGIASLNSHIALCALTVNDFIDEFNAGSVLLALEILCRPEPDVSPQPESSMSRTYSTFSHDRVSQSANSKTAVLSLEQSFKRELRANTPDVLPTRPAPPTPPPKPAELQSHTQTTPYRPDNGHVETRLGETAHPRLDAVESATNVRQGSNVRDMQPPVPQLEPDPAVVTSAPAVLRDTDTKATAPVKDDSVGLSPVQIPRGPAPLTSPNVDLSFIPIANTINPHKFDVKQDGDSSPEADLSFQAISTAIRKSFAGKLSMGHFAPQPLYSDTTNVVKKKEHAPAEKKPPARHTLAAQTLRPKLARKSSRRSSVFVSLPDREPINYSTHPTSKKPEKPLRSTFHAFHKESLFNAPPRKENAIKSENANSVKRTGTPPPVQVAVLSNANGLDSKIKSTQPTRRNPVSRIGMIPKITPTASSFRSRSRSPASRQQANPLLSKASSRTTVAGSPRHEFTVSGAGRISPLRRRSPIRSNNTLTVNSNASSATKYSEFNRSNTRSSPTNDSTLSKRASPADNPKAANYTTVGKSLKSRETIIRNKFLTTKLNPENPPQFLPVKNQKRQVSPIKKMPAVHTAINERLSKKISLHNSKLENSSRQKQKITISLSHKTEASFPATEKIRPERTTRSPARTASPRAATSRSPTRTNISRGDTLNERLSRKSLKRAPEPNDIHIAPRKRAVGNAVPLPDAARGIFVSREKNKGPNKQPEDKNHSVKSSTRPKAQDVNEGDKYTPDNLPDIPSEDDTEKSRKYIKSWAETPEILRTMKEKQSMDPVDVFGEVPVLKIDEVFESIASRQRGQASPTRWSP